MFERFSLYKIDNIHQIPFDSKLYSKYKYGDHIQAKKFGDQLAHAFINQFHSFILKGEQQFICISSPFGCVPPAAFFIFKTFCEILNDFLVENGREQIEERKIVRVGTISEDYSLLSRSERLMRINEERYFIDKNGLENKFLLFLDDIRITGEL
ncbi:unnamed protein product [Didymodactylos carnosus]|uniref:Uncharacterized protein n=1 Tax=Didymodactylos carnosus TaxID=1234261 RepID=A0A8S2S912_9BILA|nr:unnamed protein product [Didymodactylos carnosus]CAF4214897.1 unnamed protein product [Didymodactylos carnosus]